jgi:hypothetical protein
MAEAAAVDSMPSPRGSSPLVRTLVKLVSLSAVGALLFVFHEISFHLTPWSQAIINGIVSTLDWRRPCQEANQTPAGQARR